VDCKPTGTRTARIGIAIDGHAQCALCEGMLSVFLGGCWEEEPDQPAKEK
jgi:hypothetical protein